MSAASTACFDTEVSDTPLAEPQTGGMGAGNSSCYRVQVVWPQRVDRGSAAGAPAEQDRHLPHVSEECWCASGRAPGVSRPGGARWRLRCPKSSEPLCGDAALGLIHRTITAVTAVMIATTIGVSVVIHARRVSARVGVSFGSVIGELLSLVRRCLPGKVVVRGAAAARPLRSLLPPKNGLATRRCECA